jgi:hypothetical protein
MRRFVLITAVALGVVLASDTVEINPHLDPLNATYNIDNEKVTLVEG